jgi:hypothetical protein
MYTKNNEVCKIQTKIFGNYLFSEKNTLFSNLQLATSSLLLACMAFYSALKMEVVCSSETSVNLTGTHGVTFRKIALFIPHEDYRLIAERRSERPNDTEDMLAGA